LRPFDLLVVRKLMADSGTVAHRQAIRERVRGDGKQPGSLGHSHDTPIAISVRTAKLIFDSIVNLILQIVESVGGKCVPRECPQRFRAVELQP